jgi:large subunit ribosomal protein L22
MQAKAKLSHLRMSPKKVRLVVDVIRGSKVDEALTQLEFLNKAAKKPVIKLLNSAIANAENNLDLKRDNLFVKEVKVDLAGMLKRWHPRAHGRAAPIRKKMSHVYIVLDEIEPTKPKKAKKPVKTEKAVKVKSLDEIKELPEAKKVEPKKDLTKTSKESEKETTEKEKNDPRMEGKHRHQQHGDKRSMKQGKGFINKIFNRKVG